MWQRIQTLYFAVAAALVIALLWSAKAVVYSAGLDPEYIKYTSYLPYLILIIVASILEVLALTTYRFRIFQMRTAILVSLVLLALQGWIAVDYLQAPASQVFRYTAVFPLVAVIFNLLAARAAYADEILIQSASRLRAAKRKKR